MPLGTGRQSFKIAWNAIQHELAIVDVNAILRKNVAKKLAFWSTIHLSLASKVVRMNFAFLFTLWYFFWVAQLKSHIKLEGTYQ